MWMKISAQKLIKEVQSNEKKTTFESTQESKSTRILWREIHQNRNDCSAMNVNILLVLNCNFQNKIKVKTLHYWNEGCHMKKHSMKKETWNA